MYPSQAEWGPRCVAVLSNGNLCLAKATLGCYCRWHASGASLSDRPHAHGR